MAGSFANAVDWSGLFSEELENSVSRLRVVLSVGHCSELAIRGGDSVFEGPRIVVNEPISEPREY